MSIWKREITKEEKAFANAIKSKLMYTKIPRPAVTAFLLTEDYIKFQDGKYGEYYETIEDFWHVFNYAIEHERERCINICEGFGENGLSPFDCADKIIGNR